MASPFIPIGAKVACPHEGHGGANGFPVFAAEVADLDTAGRADSLDAHPRLTDAVARHPDVRRALAPLDPVLQPIRDRIPSVLEQRVTPPLVEVLWLAGADWAAPVAVGRVEQDVRDKPTHARAQINGTLVAPLAGDLLTVHAPPPDAIRAARLYTDHRARHLTAGPDGIRSRPPQPDPSQDRPATGTVLGSASPVGGLSALACAKTRARVDNGPVRHISNPHSSGRAVVPTRPQPIPAPTPPAPAGA